MLCPGSVGTESSMLSSGNDIVMPMKRWFREHSMLTSGNGIVMPKKRWN